MVPIMRPGVPSLGLWRRAIGGEREAKEGAEAGERDYHVGNGNRRGLQLLDVSLYGQARGGVMGLCAEYLGGPGLRITSSLIMKNEGIPSVWLCMRHGLRSLHTSEDLEL